MQDVSHQYYYWYKEEAHSDDLFDLYSVLGEPDAKPCDLMECGQVLCHSVELLH